MASNDFLTYTRDSADKARQMVYFLDIEKEFLIFKGLLVDLFIITSSLPKKDPSNSPRHQRPPAPPTLLTRHGLGNPGDFH